MVLGLAGMLAKEWDMYIYNLNQGNFTLSTKYDKMVWAFNAREGQVTAKLAHRSIILNNSYSETKWWMHWLWKGSVPLKIKLFSWLCLKNKY